MYIIKKDITEDQRNKATKELYKLLYTDAINTKLDDVKKWVEEGAYLIGIRIRYGIPLLYAIYKSCSPDIIKYLIEKGGLDWNYKEPLKIEHYEIHPIKKYTLYVYYIIYYSIMNVLISKKYSYTNNIHIIRNIISKQFKKECPRFRYFKSKPNEKFVVNKKNILVIKRLKEYCKILNIKYEDLHHKNYVLPESVKYDHYKDYKDYFPSDDEPYFWEPENVDE